MAAYPRGGGESRLHGRWSIGVGGHVNRQDSPKDFTGAAGWKTALWQGMRRELQEEFPAAATGDPQFLGLIHEAGSPVGQVHLGLVFLQEVNADLSSAGSDLTGLCWLPPSAFGSEEWPVHRFEFWSQLAYQLLEHASTGGSADSTLPHRDKSNQSS